MSHKRDRRAARKAKADRRYGDWQQRRSSAKPGRQSPSKTRRWQDGDGGNI